MEKYEKPKLEEIELMLEEILVPSLFGGDQAGDNLFDWDAIFD